MGCSRVKRLHSSEDIPCECRTGYIQTGYRPVPCSLEDCIKSAFQLNNETVNFWTHFIPFILMVRRSYGIVSSFEDPFDPINFAYYVHSIATIYVFIVSSAAHLFSTHSVSYNGRCFSVDRAAIVTQGFSMKLVVENLMCPASCYLVQDTSRPTYLFFTVLVAVLVTSLFCAGTLPKLKRFKSQLRSLPFGVAGFLINFPCILRYSFTNQSSEQDCFDLAKGHHTLFYLQASASLLAGVFFALRIPERFYPGRFDIFGSSHQIFHVLIAIGLYFQNKLIEEVTEEAKYKINAGEISHEVLGTHWMYTIGVFVLVTVVVHSIVVLFYWKIDPCSKTTENAEKQE